jgi:hypothetical protein
MEPKIIEPTSSQSHEISVNMKIIGNTEGILCTNVYGPQRLEEKRRMLVDLENIKSISRNLH